jgi:ABC-type transport system involved in multi-copper enzyme maturation permease subunit
MSSAVTSAGPSRVAPVRSDHLLWVIRSEWTKLWSLRSTGWTLLATVVATIGFSTLAAWALTTQPDSRPSGPLDVTGAALSGLFLGQLPIAVLGVLAITAEYSTGSIRTSLAAVPARLRLLTAKAVVITVVAFGTGIVACFPSFFLAMAFFNANDEGVGLGDPHVLRAVIGGALLLATCGLFGYAIGILMRHTAGAITVSVALLFLIPIVLGSIPADVVRTINKYFLSNAGDDITSVIRQPDTLGAWQGYLVFLAEVALLLVTAAVVMRRRDA